MKARIPHILVCALLAFAPLAVSSSGATPIQDGQPKTDPTDGLGLSLTDPLVTDAMNLFNLGKVDDAIDLIDRTIKERVQGDPERNRELKLLAGILAARSDRKIPDVNTRLRAATGVNDSRSTTTKAEVAIDAVKWAVKNGKKGDRPDLKKAEDWLRALDGAREDYVKDLNTKYELLARAVHERQFAGLEPLVKADKQVLDRVMVIQYLPEKNNDARSGFLDKLRQIESEVHAEKEAVHAEIRDLRRDQGKLPQDSPKRRQIDDKIEMRQKQLSEADKATDMLRKTIQSIKT
jgi:hypothetical protein